ncbi:MAG: hypothetical protein BV457_07430 [Thermoplasmata archaeon M9B1D]|nr:MAG: hypothetical protein BV457_07430 [Thermoplasmata archaeon M9B1D]
MQNKLFVLDLETTGFDEVFDRVVAITIYDLNLEDYSYKKIYDEIIWQDITQDFVKNCWIVEQGYYTLEEINRGKDQSLVIKEVDALLTNQMATSYNTSFDFDKFIIRQWKIKTVKVPYCLMLESTDIVRIPWYDYEGNFTGYKWPKLPEAYYYFYNERMPEKHRSSYDTELAVKIAIALDKYKKHFYLILESLKTQKELIIIYTSKKRETLERKIKPLQIKEEQTQVEAFDYLRQENRTFAIGRRSEIKEIE